MRRLMQYFWAWWNRPVTVDYEPLTGQQALGARIAESERLRLTHDELLTPPPMPAIPDPPMDTLPQVYQTNGAQAEATAIGNACWPDWKPPIPALPRRVQRQVRETAREIRSDLTGAIFTADDLSLPDDPFIPDVEWAQRVYDHLWYCKRNMSIEQHNALYRLELTPRLGRTTFTIFAPPDWCEDRDAMQNIENALLNEVNSALALVITMPHTRFDWRPSPSLAVCWAVSIAAVDAPMQGVA